MGKNFLGIDAVDPFLNSEVYAPTRHEFFAVSHLLNNNNRGQKYIIN